MRLFFALGLTDDERHSLALSYQMGLPGARWFDSNRFHITLRFVGEVDLAICRALIESAKTIVHGAGSSRITEVGFFRTGQRTSPVVLKIEASPWIVDLKRKVDQILRREGLVLEGRKYTPHITLGSIRGGLPFQMASWCALHGLPPVLAEHQTFSLFESHLGKHGPIYTEIEAFSFHRFPVLLEPRSPAV